MAKKNLFGWMFVEDEQSQKPAESVKKEPTLFVKLLLLQIM